MSSSFDRNWDRIQQGRNSDHCRLTHHINSDLVQKAKFLYKARRQREKEFVDPTIFADPAWDMMLGLYIDEGEGRGTQVSSAVISACVAATTGLRWVKKLIDLDIIVRTDDPFDRRRSYVRLTPETRERISRLLELR